MIFLGLEFELNANEVLWQFRYTIKQSWIVYVSIGRALWTATGCGGEMNFQPIEINGKVQIQRYLPAPPAYNACACSVARHCPDPSWSGAQFLCYYGDNCTSGTVIWSIPGLVKSCTSFDSVLASDLRCFFNKTCLDILLSMYNVDMPKRQPLSSATLNTTVLNISILSTFRPEDTIQSILNELTIDNWKISTNYYKYYNSCAPAKCVYTITRRLDLFYVLTMITTYFGGLAVTFRLFVPICVRFLYWIFTCRHNNHSNINDQRSREISSGEYRFSFEE